ncbi:MAG: YggT family protein [Thermodesulfobacteriota bacterium]
MPTGQPDSLLLSLASLINILLTVYMWIVIIRAVISWVRPNPYNPVVKFLTRVTDPVLYQFRRLLPASYGGIDFSPILLLLVLVFLNDFVVNSLVIIAKGRSFHLILYVLAASFIRLAQGILFAFMIILIVRAILSWISPDPYNPIVMFVFGVTEPVLYPLRRLLPLVFGGIDLTPVLLIAAIYFFNSFLARLMTPLIVRLGG